MLTTEEVRGGSVPSPVGPDPFEADEQERRRIARELHYDVGQGLALLSLEFDLLGRDPPGSPNPTRLARPRTGPERRLTP